VKKYLSVFKVSLEQEFAYRANFIMSRVRNILQIFLVFFLWDAVFADSGRIVFGYDRAGILTYVFGILIVRSFVLSARSNNVSGEISSGDLSNYLVKPVSYFKYWLTRDFSSKVLNLIFAFFETSLLIILLKPPLFIQKNIVNLGGFLILLSLAVFIYFTILFIASSVPFWMPEAAWGVQFVFIVVIVEFLSGSLFPLDVLPLSFQRVLNLTPFPYLIYFPIQVYLGKVENFLILKAVFVSAVWAVILWFLMDYIWKKGLKVFETYGR